jgi:hypothetical protein
MYRRGVGDGDTPCAAAKGTPMTLRELIQEHLNTADSIAKKQIDDLGNVTDERIVLHWRSRWIGIEHLLNDLCRINSPILDLPIESPEEPQP